MSSLPERGLSQTAAGPFTKVVTRFPSFPHQHPLRVEDNSRSAASPNLARLSLFVSQRLNVIELGRLELRNKPGISPASTPGKGTIGEMRTCHSVIGTNSKPKTNGVFPVGWAYHFGNLAARQAWFRRVLQSSVNLNARQCPPERLTEDSSDDTARQHENNSVAPVASRTDQSEALDSLRPERPSHRQREATLGNPAGSPGGGRAVE